MSDLLPALSPIVLRVRPDITWKKDKTGATVCQRKVPLSEERLRQHLNGGNAVGVCPIKEGESTTEIAVLDLDSHKGEVPWPEMQALAEKIIQHFEKQNCYPVAFRSSGGRGVHIFFLWTKPQDAYSVREFLTEQLGKLNFKIGTLGVAKNEIEIFPKQDSVPFGGCGNQFILPLAGQSVPLDPFLAFDPVSREAALDIDWVSSEPVPVLEKTEKEITKRQHYDGDVTELQKALTVIPSETNYDLWIKIGMALHAETDGSEEGLELWEEWSERCADYNGREELEYKWDSFRNDKTKVITAGSIKKLAREHGWIEDYSVDFDIIEPQKTSEKDTSRFPLIEAKDFAERPQSPWIIKGILPQARLVIIFGESGAGKSFIALDMALAIARGIEWNGKRTKQKRVVYIAAEGVGGFGKRLKAYGQKNECDLPIKLIADAPNFLLKNDALDVAKSINGGGGADVIFVDTWAQVTPGANENTAEDMGKALAHCNGIHAVTGAVVVLVHHAGKDLTKGSRGWSGLKAAADAEIEVTREDDKRAFRVSKQKDAEDGEMWSFVLDSVDLGEDTDGDKITSCTVSINGPVAKIEKHKKRGKWQRRVLASFERLGSENVRLESLYEDILQNHPLEADDGKKDRRRESIGQAIDALVDEGEVMLENGYLLNNLTCN